MMFVSFVIQFGEISRPKIERMVGASQGGAQLFIDTEKNRCGSYEASWTDMTICLEASG
jgi:hypothetical protein